MSGVSFRKGLPSDARTLAELRVSQLLEEGAWGTCDLRPALLEYYRRHFVDGTFVSWVACDDGGDIVATSGLSIVEKPPYYGCPNGRIGLLSSMYVLPAWRRRGIARMLLTRIADEARKVGCGAIQVTASGMGVLLYHDFGFEHNGNFMQLPL